MRLKFQVCRLTLRRAAFFAFCFLPFAFWAQVSFEASADAREAVLGSTVEVSFTLKNAEGDRFLPPKIDGFRIVGGPNVARGMSFVNGKKSSSQTWSFVLQAQREGAFEIGPASVVSGGKTLKTAPFSIKIVASSSSKNKNRAPGAAPEGDATAFIVAEASASEAFVGEQIRVDFRLFTRADVSGISVLQEPKLEGFFAKKLERRDPDKGTATVGGKKYLTQIVHAIALFPQESGALEIGPMAFQLGVVDGGAGGLFGSFFGSTREVSSVTKPIKINVKPLPQPAPESFSGGVGRFSIESALDRTSLTTDDAAVLTLTMRGNADPKRLSPPILELPDGFEAMAPKLKEESAFENGEALMMSKTWEYFLLPRRAGEAKIQPAASVFDPEKGQYAGLFGQELALKISAGSKPVAAEPLSKNEKTSGERGEKADALSWLFWTFLTAALAVGGTLFYRKKMAQKVESNSAWLPKNTAKKAIEKNEKSTEKNERTAVETSEKKPFTETPKTTLPAESSQKRLEKARFLAQAGRSSDFFVEIQRAAEARFSEKTGLAPSAFSREKWLEKTEESGEKTRLEAFLKRLEMARFAGLGAGQDLMVFWAEAAEVLA